MDLIIDGNAFINVAISVTKSLAEKDKRTGEAYYVNDILQDSAVLKEHVRVSFRNFCFTYISSLIAPIGSSLDSVHIVFDSKSWRKEYTSSFFESSTFTTTSAPLEFKYKGNRKYDDHQYLFFDYFQQVLIPAFTSTCGVNTYRFKSTEGDDIIAHLCEILDNDLLIYSVDQDLKQLVGSLNKNILLIVPKQMSKTKKVFIPDTIIPEKAEDELDSFFSLNEAHISGSTVDKIIKNLLNKDYAKFVVDPVDEILTKILLGDKSDNIPKITNITPTKSRKIITALLEEFGDSLLSLLDSLDDTFIASFINQVCLANKVTDQDKLDEIREHLLFNIKIIRLATNVFPKDIQDTLVQFFADYSVVPFKSKEFTNLKNNQYTL